MVVNQSMVINISINLPPRKQFLLIQLPSITYVFIKYQVPIIYIANIYMHMNRKNINLISKF